MSASEQARAINYLFAKVYNRVASWPVELHAMIIERMQCKRLINRYALNAR